MIKNFTAAALAASLAASAAGFTLHTPAAATEPPVVDQGKNYYDFGIPADYYDDKPNYFVIKCGDGLEPQVVVVPDDGGLRAYGNCHPKEKVEEKK